VTTSPSPTALGADAGTAPLAVGLIVVPVGPLLAALLRRRRPPKRRRRSPTPAP
jgi:hypothetical protein